MDYLGPSESMAGTITNVDYYHIISPITETLPGGCSVELCWPTIPPALRAR